MVDKKQTEVALWEPKEFPGNDLLPMQALHEVVPLEGMPLVNREDIDPEDLVIPAIVLLHGTSGAVEDKVEGAVPGCFMHTGTEATLPEGPLRVILAHYHKGNAMFPKDDDPRYEGLKTCIAPHGVEGNRYGLCKECRKCLDWDNVNDIPPLGAETHHFVALTSWGPAMMRFSRTSFTPASRFITTWKLDPHKNLWDHPTIVRVKSGNKTLKSGKVTKYFYCHLSWQVTEKTPPELQRAALALFNEVHDKHKHGNLKSQDEPDDALFD